MNEFDVIEQYFRPLTMGRGDLRDDAAVLKIPAGKELVVTSDTLNAGVHFPDGAAPADIAHKALRVNLSDLAAMGAEPLSYQLCIAFSEKPEAEWLEAFTAALLSDQKTFGIYCSGGDTTSTKGPLSISITALGLAPEGQAVKRAGAREGDAVILTGPVGDAYLGLKNPQDDYFARAYYRPRPRTDLSTILREHAHAAIDVSDGLLADLGHICAASGLVAQIALNFEIFSPQAQKLIAAGAVSAEELLSGGDDYVLALAVAPENVAVFLKKAPGAFQIGYFRTGAAGVTVRDENGKILPVKHTGWSHF